MKLLRTVYRLTRTPKALLPRDTRTYHSRCRVGQDEWEARMRKKYPSFRYVVRHEGRV